MKKKNEPIEEPAEEPTVTSDEGSNPRPGHPLPPRPAVADEKPEGDND